MIRLFSYLLKILIITGFVLIVASVIPVGNHTLSREVEQYVQKFRGTPTGKDLESWAKDKIDTLSTDVKKAAISSEILVSEKAKLKALLNELNSQAE